MTSEENNTRPERRRIGPRPPERPRPAGAPTKQRTRIGPRDMPSSAPFSPGLCQLFGWQLVPVDEETGEIALAEITGGPRVDEATVAGWHERGFLEAVATGKAAGLVAVVAKGEAGSQSLAHLRKTHGASATTSVEPVAGGHRFVLFLSLDEALPSRTELAPGLDFLGEGGHFVPGSGARVYHGGGRPPAPLPGWLADLVAGRATYEPPPPQPEAPPAAPPRAPALPQATGTATGAPQTERTSGSLGASPQPLPARKLPETRNATTGAPQTGQTAGSGEASPQPRPARKVPETGGAAGAQQQRERQGAEPAQRLTYAEALAGVQGASRNDTVFRLACRLHQDGAEYDEALLFAKVAAAHCVPPLPADEAVRCVENAWRYDPPLAVSDLGLAERFAARHADMVRHVEEQDRWLVWAGHWWETNRRALAKMTWGTVRSLRDEAKAEKDPARKKLLFSFSRKAENVEAVQRMLELAGAELSVRAADLDRPGLVAFADGVLDLTDGTFRPGRREDLLTKHADFPYDPADPRCQDWVARQGGRRPRQPGGTVATATPSRQARATAEADSWQEKFDRWLTERCELGNDFSARAKALHADFCAWSGERVTDRRFGELVRAKGFGARKSSTYVYEGLRLRQ